MDQQKSDNSANNIRQKNYSWVIPMLTVKDLEVSLNFYQAAFNFKPNLKINNDDGHLIYADMMYKNEIIIMLMPENSCEELPCQAPISSKIPSSVAMYVYCDNVDILTKQAQTEKAKLFSKPEDLCWGDRVSTLIDLDGHRWTFATKVKEFESNAEAVMP